MGNSSKKVFEVKVPTTGSIVGRNGHFGITAVSVWSGSHDVQVGGIGKRDHMIRGGMLVTHEAMDALAEGWLRARGKLGLSASARQAIGEVAEATRKHGRAIRSDLGPHCPGLKKDIAEGLDISATKLEVVLAEGA